MLNSKKKSFQMFWLISFESLAIFERKFNWKKKKDRNIQYKIKVTDLLKSKTFTISIFCYKVKAFIISLFWSIVKGFYNISIFVDTQRLTSPKRAFNANMFLYRLFQNCALLSILHSLPHSHQPFDGCQ